MTHEHSIVRRLVVVTVTVGILIGGLGVVLVQRSETNDLRRNAATSTMATADRIATLVDGRVQSLIQQLVLLASRPTIAALDASAGTELQVALRVSDDLDDLVLYDRRGAPVAAASSRELLRARQLPDDDLAIELARTGPSVRILDDDPLPRLELTVAVESPPGRLAGALRASAPVQLLTREAEARRLSPDAAGLLVGFDGRIVASRELDRVIDGEDYPLALELAEGEPVTVADLDDGRGPVIVAAARSQQLPVWMIVELPEERALARSRGTVNATSLVVLTVVVAIVGAVIILMRRVLQPLRPLAGAVERLGAGERDVRVDEDDGYGEVRVVAAGFNRMAERLAQRQRELEQAERVARESEERLRLMVEGVEDYAIFLLTPDGRVRTWNRGAYRLLGASEDEAKGRPLRSFFDPDDPPDDPWEQAQCGGRGHSEGWYRRADGTRFFGTAVVTALDDQRQVAPGYAIVLHDTTDRRAAREAIEAALEREREAADDLRRTNQLKDGFLAMAAHELQTPLAAIMGANEILKEPDALATDEREHLRRVVQQHANDMRDIVQRLLDFSRLQAGRVSPTPEPVDLRAVIVDELDRLGHRLDGHDVQVDAPATTVELDRRAVRHILGNLLSNAAKFSEPGSRIDVAATVSDDRIEFSVTDAGIGVPDEDRDHIFELFGQSRTDRSTARGTGVGLAIVRRYAQLLGGTVDLESEVGRGSTFVVTVPRDPDAGPRSDGQQP